MNENKHFIFFVTKWSFSCLLTSRPVQFWKVSLTFLSSAFNDTGCINHFYLNRVRHLHAIKAASRFSAALVVPDELLISAFIFVGLCWLSQFWPPSSVLADNASSHGELLSVLKTHDIWFNFFPAPRHTQQKFYREQTPFYKKFLPTLAPYRSQMRCNFSCKQKGLYFKRSIRYGWYVGILTCQKFFETTDT